MQAFNINFYSLLFFVFINLFLFFMFYRFYKKQLFFEKKSIFSVSKYFYFKLSFLFLSFFFIFLSIFWFKYNSLEQSSNEGIDLVFVLDVSKSMNVADISWENWYYTRLDFSKKLIWDFVLKNKNNRFWLIIFSWEAKSVLPLTSDLDLFLTFLDWVDYKNLEKQWSSFFEAIELSSKRLLSSDSSSKAIVLISDWWDQEDKIDEKIKNFLDKNSFYFIIWVWSEKWWKIILDKNLFWEYNFQRYNWEYVISKLNEENLKKLAELSSWKYFKLDKISDLSVIEKDLEKIKKTVYLKNEKNFLKSFSRNLAFISFLLFICFIVFYIFDEKRYVK